MTTKVGVTSLIGYIHWLPMVTIVVTSGYVVATSDILVVIGNDNVIMSAVSLPTPSPPLPIVKGIILVSMLGKSRIQTVNFFTFQYKRKIRSFSRISYIVWATNGPKGICLRDCDPERCSFCRSCRAAVR